MKSYEDLDALADYPTLWEDFIYFIYINVIFYIKFSEGISRC